jgi:asparagine synthase (glutamine-hydrolysing)
MGIIPLYIGWDQHGTFMVRTESIKDTVQNTTVSSWTLYTSKMGSLYNGTREWTDYDAVKDNETSIPAEALEAAVHRIDE